MSIGNCEHSRYFHWRSIALVAGLAFASGIVAVPGRGAAADQPAAGKSPEPLDDQQIDRMMDKLRSLVLPQQKQLAREFIEKYPNSRLAAQARTILREYELYDQEAARERARADAWSDYVRNYWDERRPVFPPSTAAPLRITNRTDEPILYEVKGPMMGWAGPYRLRSGHTHEFYYPVLYRRITDEGTALHWLPLGESFVFRKIPESAPARLYAPRVN